MTQLFAHVEMAPRDPILGLNEQFNADNRPNKVNLGVGVYTTEEGKIPLLRSVAQAEAFRTQQASARGYLPIEGLKGYNTAVQSLIFGSDSPLLTNGHAITIQSLGGTGALKIGADYLKRLVPQALVAISNPSWENHRALFENAGFSVQNYTYFDAQKNGVDFEGMTTDLKRLPPQSIIVLHACCHNPTGADLTHAQWQTIVEICQQQHLIAFLDMAYQGFGENSDADAYSVRLFAQSGLPFFVSSSFSKSFSLYGERVGALTIVTESKEQADKVLSQVKRIVRTNYSNPPTFGSSVVGHILQTPELQALWFSELQEMRERIKSMRHALVKALAIHAPQTPFDFILHQNGMFSYTGLSAEAVDRLRNEFGIYAVSTGRICVAALNSKNVDHVARAIAAVL